jgi:hypothetical protein
MPLLMVHDWYEEGFNLGHKHGEEVEMNTNVTLFVPIERNLKATIETDKNLKLSDFATIVRTDRETPAIFWRENLVLKEGNTTVFQTNYVTEKDEILPLTEMHNIPLEIRQEFTGKTSPEVQALAQKIIGKRTETQRILWSFYDFVSENLSPKAGTYGKTMDMLMKEYEKDGRFYGSCKEARDFFIALCDAVGYPAKRVTGKSYQPVGHVWADVFVPVENGYKLYPVDAALGYCGMHDPLDHLFFESTPSLMPKSFLKRAWQSLNLAEEKGSYKLKIEKIE